MFVSVMYIVYGCVCTDLGSKVRAAIWLPCSAVAWKCATTPPTT